MWWENAVVYQIYPRSFQDSNGDGVGDLPGIESRLDHVRDLGVDAIWLSPIYPSPMADFGYDVADYTAIEPMFGTLEDFDRLLAAAHDRGLKLLMDIVPCHTSIEHRWFREHPDWYIWSDRDGPRNNWIGAFGGSAWSRDEQSGRWYLHSFYPEQPDLDWTNPELVAAMQDVIRFWIDRGVDGFRLDAIDRLGKDPEFRDDPPATEPAFAPINAADYRSLEHRYSKGTAPGVGDALAAIREAAGDAFLIGEIYLPTTEWGPYLEHLDRVFAFELFLSPQPWQVGRLRGAIERALELDGAWVFSNHDSPRLATRLGGDNERLAAMLMLTLPGLAFIYAGDEIGLRDGAGADPPFDRAGRDGARHPMQWDASANGGFSGGVPGLPSVDPAVRNVADQRGDPASLLSFYRELIALRSRLGEGVRLLDAGEGVLAYERGGDHVVGLNVDGQVEATPPVADVVLPTTDDALAEDGGLRPFSGAVFRQA